MHVKKSISITENEFKGSNKKMPLLHKNRVRMHEPKATASFIIASIDVMMKLAVTFSFSKELLQT